MFKNNILPIINCYQNSSTNAKPGYEKCSLFIGSKLILSKLINSLSVFCVTRLLGDPTCVFKSTSFKLDILVQSNDESKLKLSVQFSCIYNILILLKSVCASLKLNSCIYH